jgi:hypothetical protein
MKKAREKEERDEKRQPNKEKSRLEMRESCQRMGEGATVCIE